MMTEYDPALVERLIGVAREFDAEWDKNGMTAIGSGHPITRRLRAIVAELPAPVDPDLLAAREIAAEIAPRQNWVASDFIDGKYDDTPAIEGLLKAIRKGRELGGAA
jgi:hypothetical protein